MISPRTVLSTLLFSTLAISVPLTPSATTSVSSVTPTLLAAEALHTGPLGIAIHNSCSSTQSRQILAGLEDTEEFVHTAYTHILKHGRFSPIFKKYFGNSPTAEVLGWFTRILYGAKPGALFRCDDIDGNCARDSTWAGHHRGSNATEETVICPPSYTKRLRLEKMCTEGYTVAGNKTNVFWASDLLHRLLHVPGASEDAVKHFSDGYNEVLDYAKSVNETEVSQRTKNSDGLIYFALEVYANEVAVPGVGCVGEPVVETKTEEAKPVETKKADNCHTHADGTLHCE